jgi:hypothetical protein
MSDRHGTIEFQVLHTRSVDIDFLDEDRDEYFIAALAPNAAIRQYAPAGARWSVRIANAFGLEGATNVNVRDHEFVERSTVDLAGLRAGSAGQGWTVEVQYVVTAGAGPQTYVGDPNGVRRVLDAAVGAPGGPESADTEQKAGDWSSFDRATRPVSRAARARHS